MRLLLAAVLLLTAGGCASHALWLNGHPPILETHQAEVRIYRAGQDCRIEVVLPTYTIVTLPTRCLTVPRWQP
jgi:hypothetical protein